jgi:hypothetical protein
MSQEKYIGMDVHDASISAAVRNAEGRLLMECVLETKADTVLEFKDDELLVVQSFSEPFSAARSRSHERPLV